MQSDTMAGRRVDDLEESGGADVPGAITDSPMSFGGYEITVLRGPITVWEGSLVAKAWSEIQELVSAFFFFHNRTIRRTLLDRMKSFCFPTTSTWAPEYYSRETGRLNRDHTQSDIRLSCTFCSAINNAFDYFSRRIYCSCPQTLNDRKRLCRTAIVI